MKRDRLTVIIPSVVFWILAVEYWNPVMNVLGVDLKILIVLFLIFNVYSLGISQIVRIKGWDPYRYLWVFSAYIFIPFFIELCEILSISPLLGVFFSFSLGIAIEYSMFKDVFLWLDLARLAILFLTVQGLITWLPGCPGHL